MHPLCDVSSPRFLRNMYPKTHFGVHILIDMYPKTHFRVHIPLIDPS